MSPDLEALRELLRAGWQPTANDSADGAAAENG